MLNENTSATISITPKVLAGVIAAAAAVVVLAVAAVAVGAVVVVVKLTPKIVYLRGTIGELPAHKGSSGQSTNFNVKILHSDWNKLGEDVSCFQGHQDDYSLSTMLTNFVGTNCQSPVQLIHVSRKRHDLHTHFAISSLGLHHRRGHPDLACANAQ